LSAPPRSGRVACKAEEDAFGQELPHQPAGSCPEGAADDHLLATRCRARQQQVRDVHTGDRQYEQHRDDQQRQAEPGLRRHQFFSDRRDVDAPTRVGTRVVAFDSSRDDGQFLLRLVERDIRAQAPVDKKRPLTPGLEVRMAARSIVSCQPIIDRFATGCQGGFLFPGVKDAERAQFLRDDDVCPRCGGAVRGSRHLCSRRSRQTLTAANVAILSGVASDALRKAPRTARPTIMRRSSPLPVGVLLLLCAAMTACGGAGSGGQTAPERDPDSRHLLIVLDGLRPDYVTPALMPALHALGQRGVVMRSHHAVFPTVTRVNASSISTGAYPAAHGLMGNSVFFPDVDPGRFLNTSDRANLLRVEETGERLLTAPTLGESLLTAGERLLVMSSGSSGSSYLLNHTVAGGAILHYDYSLPEMLHSRALTELGDVPAASTPNHARNRWIVDAFLEVGLPEVDPAVTVMWLSDPDTTAHQHGIGHPLTGEALFRLDAEIKRIQDGLADAGLLETTNIWVTSDHGFSEHTGGVNLADLLAPFTGTLDDGSPRIVAGAGAIYVRDNDQAVVSEIVSALQRDDRVGAVFTRSARPGAQEGSVPGTLSFDLAHWDHERSAQILYSPNWSEMVGEYGYPGTSAQGGVAGHGSSSPFDIHNPLVAAGPDLKTRVEIDVPSGNVDFAPTFLHLLDLDIPRPMQGRVLHDALRDGSDPTMAAIETTEVTVENEDGSYVLTAVLSGVDGRSYLDYTTVERRDLVAERD
jgi:hypothetical protein